MRCLNKVVFINSANVPYAEVRLDGNVHFIGTQGVGKSTLLRAILFFYNGDKLKLGIPKEKKGFDDFYLPHSNSYIVYEVAHEYGPFCVLVFRSQGRACFRFIDSAFDRNWLVDQMTGDVTSEYTVIRQRLSGHYMSRIVDKYDEYRNIIYGNHRATDKEFYKFALMESPKYQNIPRSLQNVFLNSRVDAEFIKEIIIRSMNDDEATIDLGYYRRQVAEFEQEYNDISIWFRPNSPVRSQADKTVQIYRKLIYHKDLIVGLYAELLYALRLARENAPEIEAQIQKQAAEIRRIEALSSEEKQKFDKENAELNRSIGAVDQRLKDIRSKRKHYQEIQIEGILKRVDAEKDVKISLESLIKTKDLLTQESRSLSSKYEMLENNLISEFKEYESSSKDRISSVKEEALKSLERNSSLRENARAALDEEFAEAFAMLNTRSEDNSLKERDLEKELVRLGFLHPMAQQINAEKEGLRQLKSSEDELKSESSNLSLQIDLLKREFSSECAELERGRDVQIKELEREAEAVRSKIEEIDLLLSNAEGSLYEWLDKNRPGWENNFGKVVDHAKVLYNKSLTPVAAGKSPDTIFGVSLNLSELESEVRTPTDLKQEKEMYENALLDMAERKDELIRSTQLLLTELSDKHAPQMKALREKKSVVEAKLMSLPEQIKTAQIKIKGLEDKEADILAVRKKELDERRMQLAGEKAGIERDTESVKEAKARKIRNLDKDYSDSRAKIVSDRDSRIGEIRSSVDMKAGELKLAMEQLKARRDAELKGAGVDTFALTECERKISEVRNELRFIEDNRQICIEYQIDKRDLLDREDEFKDNKAALDKKRSQLEDKYRIRGRKLEEQLSAAQGRHASLKKDLEDCQEGVRKAEDFQTSDMFPVYLETVIERATMSPALGLVDDLRTAIFERNELMNKFKQALNLFKGNFGPDNTFKFRTNLTTDDEYLDFASGLEEFLDQNKIEDYRDRTSDRYLEILMRASREMGEIMRHGAEVEKTIADINYDFKEKNFVGAIKSIQIRRTESGDKMVQLLLRIKEFSDENQLHLSGINLFSSTDENADVNKMAVRFLQDFMGCLNEFAMRQYLTLSDTFQLQFRVVENDNDTGWVEKIANVGSDGTDILVKAMVNIMLINVFKEKVSRKFGEFRIHCMMDEIGKLHPSNVKGILDFANSRNILLINSSPTTYNVSDYRYTYLLSKDAQSKTLVTALITRKEAELGR